MAPSFEDSQKRRWMVNLTLGVCDAIQDATGVDLLADGDTAGVMGLLFDRRKLAAALWECVVKQAAEKQISREAFIEALDGDALTGGWGAVVDAIVFFTPSQSRKAVQAAIDTQCKALEAGVQAMADLATSDETNRAIGEAVLKMKTELQATLPEMLAGSAGT